MQIKAEVELAFKSIPDALDNNSQKKRWQNFFFLRVKHPIIAPFFFAPLPEIHKSLRHLPRQTHCRQKSSLLPLSSVCFRGLIYLAISRGAFSPSWKEDSVNTVQQRAFCSSSNVERASWRQSYLYIYTTWWRYWVTLRLCPCPLQNLLIPCKTFFHI